MNIKKLAEEHADGLTKSGMAYKFAPESIAYQSFINGYEVGTSEMGRMTDAIYIAIEELKSCEETMVLATEEIERLRSEILSMKSANRYQRGHSDGFKEAETKFQTELTKLRGIISESLKAIPVGNVNVHTPENLPILIDDLSEQVGEYCGEADELRTELHRLSLGMDAKTVLDTWVANVGQRGDPSLGRLQTLIQSAIEHGRRGEL